MTEKSTWPKRHNVKYHMVIHVQFPFVTVVSACIMIKRTKRGTGGTKCNWSYLCAVGVIHFNELV